MALLLQVYQLNKFKYAKISGKENGSVKKGVIFATYSSLIGECRTAKSRYRSRLKQLIQWFGPVSLVIDKVLSVAFTYCPLTLSGQGQCIVDILVLTVNLTMSQ